MAPDGAVGAYEAMTPSSSFALNGLRRTIDGEDMTVRSRRVRYTANRARVSDPQALPTFTQFEFRIQALDT